MANSYFEDELKKALARLGVTDKRGDLTAPVASKFQQRVAFDNYRVPSTFTPQEQRYLDSLKVRSYVDEERKRRQMLERVSSVSDYAKADNRLQELVWQGQIEKDRANQLFEITKSHFEEISRKPEYTSAYNEYINQAANDRSRITREKLVDVTKEIEEERPYKKWLWEQAINEMAASEEVQSVADSIALRRELIGKLPDTDVKPHEIPDQEEIISREPLKRPRLGAGIIAPDVLDQAAVAERPQGIIDQKVDKKGNTVGNYFIGSLLSTVRSLFTAGTFTPEEQAEIKASRGKEENLTAAEKFMVSVMTRSAKNMAKRGGGRSLIPLADAVDVGGMTEKTTDYLLSSGYKLEQLERPFYERADIENKPWYTKIVAKGVAAIPSLALVSATGVAGIGMLTVSSMKTNTENISRRINTGEDISDAASIAYVVGNAALDAFAYSMFSKLSNPGSPSPSAAVSGWLRKAFGRSAPQVVRNIAGSSSVLSVLTKQYASIIAEAGAINLTNYVLSGFLSKLTVDKEKVLFGLSKDELITLTGALGAFGSGAVKGAFIGIARFAKQKSFVEEYAKLSNRSPKDITMSELYDLYRGSIKVAEDYTNDYAEAASGGLQKIARGNEITDAGAKHTPNAVDPRFAAPTEVTVAETGAATKQASTVAQPPIEKPAETTKTEAKPQLLLSPPKKEKSYNLDAQYEYEVLVDREGSIRLVKKVTAIRPEKAEEIGYEFKVTYGTDGKIRITKVDKKDKPLALPPPKRGKPVEDEYEYIPSVDKDGNIKFIKKLKAATYQPAQEGEPLALEGPKQTVFEEVYVYEPYYDKDGNLKLRKIIKPIREKAAPVAEPEPEITPTEPARRKLVGAKPDTDTGVTVVEGTGDISPPATAPKPEPKATVPKPKETYVSSKAEPIAVGKELRSSISGKEYQNTQVNVVKLNDVIPSMDANGVAMKGYDKKFQPRDTERASSRLFIDDIARELNPDKFFEKETIQNGIPVIDKNGMVIVGNHRVAALLRAKQQYPEKYEAYKETALANATELGLNPEDLQGDFIVARLLPENADGQAIADKSNIAEQRDMSAAELARRDANYIDGEVLDAFVATDSGTILSRENERFRNLFLEKVLGSRIDGFMDKDGNYSIEGINRMNNALFYKAYGDNAVSALAAESQDHNFKRIITAMRNVAPRIVTLDREIESGKAFDVDIKSLILESAQRYMTMKNNKEDIFFFATNQEMGDTPEIVRAKRMMYLMQQNSGSHQRLTDMYNALIDGVGLAGDPKQLDMFGRDTPTVDELIEAAIRTAGDTRMLERAGGEKDGETTKVAETGIQGRGRTAIGERDARESPAKTEIKQKANKQVSDKTYAESISEVSERQETSGRAGIVAPGFSQTHTKQPQHIRQYQGPKNDTVRNEFVTAKEHPQKKSKSLWQSSKDFVTKTFFRSSVPEVDYKYGQTRANVVRLRKRHTISMTQSWDELKAVYDPIHSEYKTAMDYAVFLPDLVEDINLGKYTDDNLPFGFTSRAEVITENNNLQKLINDPTDPTIKNALKARQKVFDTNRKEILDLASKLGVDMSGFFTREDYVHHAIIDYVEQANADPRYKKSTDSILRARDGSMKAYITDAVLADYIALNKMKDIRIKLEVLQDLQNQDITKSLKQDAKGQLLIPDGYEKVDSSIVGFVFPDQLLKNNAIDVAKAIIRSAGINASHPAAKQMLAEAASTQRNTEYVIPSDVAEAYKSVFKPKETGALKDLYKVTDKVMGQWKRYQLVHPRRAVKFSLRNATSDFSKVLGFAPKSLGKHTVTSVQELTKYYTGKSISPTLVQYVEAGGLFNGLVNIELGDTKDLEKLNIYDKHGNVKPMEQIIKMVAKPLNGLENLYDWREQILRYAAFNYYMNEGLDPKTNQPKDGNYRASVPREIQGMTSRRDIAYKMSNDLVGAYDDATPFTQYVSKRVVPFFRYQETTVKAYFRGIKNSFYKNPELVQAIGEKVSNNYGQAAKAAGGAAAHAAYGVWNLVKFIIGATSLEIAFELWNRGVKKEEDDQIPSYARNKSHITLGKWGGKVYYLEDLGPFRDALEWIGFDNPINDLKDIFSGKKTIGEKAVEIITAPYQKFTEGFSPFTTPIVEAKLGRQMFSGAYIRDPKEYVASLFQFGPVYRALAGKPQKDGKFDWNIFAVQKAYEGESQFWDIYTLRDDYLKSVGKPPMPQYPPSQEAKSKALYEFRTAIRFRDEKAAMKYLTKYFEAGGTIDGIAQSARAINPLQTMKKDDREAFLKSLKGEDKVNYEAGMEFYRWYADDMLKFARYNMTQAQKAVTDKSKANKRR